MIRGPHRHRVRTPTVFQMEATECGAASLGMVLGYHGCHEPLEKLRVACGVSRNGSQASLLLKAARGYGLEAKGFKVSVEKLAGMPVPSILFWNFDHFVVYEGRRGDIFHINDPASGPRPVALEEFEKSFTGVVLTFQPTADFKPGGRPRGLISALLPLLGQVKASCAVVVWAGLLLVLPGLLLPTMLRIFVDEVMSDKAEWLVALLLVYAATVLVQVLLVWLQRVAFRRGELKLAANNTVAMLGHFFSLPVEFFLQRHSADLQHRVMLNAQVAKTVFGQIGNSATQALTAIFFLALMFCLSPFLSWIVLATAALNFLALVLVNRSRQVLNQSLVTVETKLIQRSMTGISLMETLRSGGREDDFFSEWSNGLAEYVNARRRMQHSGTLLNIVPVLLFGLNSTLVLCFGAWQIIEGGMTLGGMMAFQALMAGFVTPVNSLVMAGTQMQELRGTIERIEDVFRYPFTERFRSADGEESLRPGKLELRDISFGYSRLAPPLIERFSLTLEAGSRVALVGTSGSGKSTVAKIAAGLFAPWQGEILLGGRPIASWSREEFYRSVASVDQNIILFSGSVRDNLTLFQRHSEACDLHEALSDAEIVGELAQRGNELDVPVGEMGNNFSGGQRQRLEIARALARNAPILILDEATSALDPTTELMIDRAIRRRGCSCLIVAHRLSTIRDCDEIIMLEYGKIIARGTHSALMESCASYANLMRLETERPHA
ncbi:MAG: NHLP family bacteriocin export ABC transporter peptidase/permease/ATPase subunit [Verrucomicrobiae bacterium]